jgi:RND family efflux transporter MFP subunit
MSVRVSGGAKVLAMALVAVTIGCRNNPGSTPEEKPLQVDAAVPVAQTITDYEIFSGRTEAIESTDVRARVTGYLDKINFTDGAFVKAGDVLFVIDPRPYEAALAKAKASVAQARASIRQAEATVALGQSNLNYLSAELARNRQLSRTGAVSGSEMDKSQGDVGATAATISAAKAQVEVAKANVKAAEAEEKAAQLNVDFTKVTAPISGVISRRFADRGTMVLGDQTVLTNIVRLDKIYAYFDIDERTWLDLRRRLMDEGRIDSIQKKVLPVWIGLARDTGYGFQGQIDFADNKLDPSTGTMRMRGTFDNTDLYFQPGMFVRVRLPVGRPHEALLIAEQAIGNDQGRQYVYVLNGKNEVVYRRIETGALHDGLREIKSRRYDSDAPLDEGEGLRKGDRVVLNGLQRLRPGMPVEPTLVAMPNPRMAAANRAKPGSAGAGSAQGEAKSGQAATK